MSQPHIVPLNFETMGQLDDGLIDQVLRRHLMAVAQDCINRPADKTKRKVTLEFTVSPVLNQQTRECEIAQVEIECKSKVPVHRSAIYPMRVSKGGLLFNQDFPESLHQGSLLDDEEDDV